MADFSYMETLLAFLCLLFISHWFKNRNSPIITWPVLGVIPGMLYNFWNVHDYVTAIMKKSGGTFKFKGPWFSNLDFIVTSDYRNVQHIVSKNFYNYDRGPDFKDIFDALGDGILISESDTWKLQRSMIKGLMKHSKFQNFFHEKFLQQVENGLVPILEHFSRLQSVLDIQDVFYRLNFDFTCAYILGVHSNCLSVDFPEVPHEKAFDAMEDAMLYRHVVPQSWWKLQRWLQIGQEKRLTKCWEICDRFLYKCISLKREEFSKRMNEMKGENLGKNGSFDIMTGLMEEMDDIADEKSNIFLRDQAFSLMAAGRGPLSIGLAWVMWFIATNPILENKILQELKEIFEEKEGEKMKIFTMEKLRNSVYLHGVLCETMRLYPPLAYNHKAPIQSDVLPSGHKINKNGRVLISMYAMGRMEEIWGEDCLEFKPERWISEEGRSINPPAYKFIAFNAGPRSCLGKDITFIQMNIIVATIVWNYHVRVVEGHFASPRSSIVLPIRNGLKVRITKRCV